MIAAGKRTAGNVCSQIRRLLRDGGSVEHAKGVQWFFKEDVKSHGWYTGALRKLARSYRREILGDRNVDFLVGVADGLFKGRVLEEKIFAVLLLENMTGRFGQEQFLLFESWLGRITSWADHDALVHYLIAPLVAAEPNRLRHVFNWARSADRWHRRAACVALIQGSRQKMFFSQIVALSNLLLPDKDDMVQKGLGWVLRETAKRSPRQTVAYLMKIRRDAPRLVLRTACETLPTRERARILAKRVQ